MERERREFELSEKDESHVYLFVQLVELSFQSMRLAI